ncbi:MAG: response regulator transcription factor [Deltaproteobacteria bacterium]|nr:response regulator transcription factor [Deltaproteobacteria bacterium]
MTFTIGIVEHEAAARAELAALLGPEPATRVAFAVATLAEARALLDAAPASFVVVDLDLPGADTLAFVRDLAGRTPPVEAAVLTTAAEDVRVFEALFAGAVGHLIRSAPAAETLAFVATVRDGGAAMSPAFARLVRDALLPEVTLCEVAVGDGALTAREQEVLALLAQGFLYENVAARLKLSTHTVRAHIRNIYRKLHVNSRAQAVYEALKRRIISLA